MKEINRRRRGHQFYPPKSLHVPPLGVQEATGTPLEDTVLYVHYFIGGSDWYVAELTANEAFGWACLNGDTDNAEWGYVDLEELERVLVTSLNLPVERDLHFEPCKFSELKS